MPRLKPSCHPENLDGSPERPALRLPLALLLSPSLGPNIVFGWAADLPDTSIFYRSISQCASHGAKPEETRRSRDPVRLLLSQLTTSPGRSQPGSSCPSACEGSAGVSSIGEKDTRRACRSRRRCGRQRWTLLGSTGFSARPRSCAWNTENSNGWRRPAPYQRGRRWRRQRFLEKFDCDANPFSPSMGTSM